ncbi:hypothetical protein ACIBAH_21840 [Streptomyces sp. NPDC051445]|uniref:hypothetical protein n=1 Tax=Streptomyces sp. NPDC051445 TaxID=3365653 RepID=UPI0037980BEA
MTRNGFPGPSAFGVGRRQGAQADGVSTPLLHHFDGRRWTVRTVPAPYAYGPGWVANHLVSTGRGTVHVFGKTNDPQVPRGLLATRWDGRAWRQIPTPGVDEVNATGTDGSGNGWVAGWRPHGSSHSLLSRWDGTPWTEEELPAELTSTSEGSTVFDIEGIPGIRAVPPRATPGVAASRARAACWCRAGSADEEGPLVARTCPRATDGPSGEQSPTLKDVRPAAPQRRL